LSGEASDRAVLLRRRTLPHMTRTVLGHASLMGKGWGEFNAAAEGGDKFVQISALYHMQTSRLSTPAI